jgi:DNA-binding LacI/PurR family transcriptional regulator
MGAYLRPALSTVSTHPELAARRLCEVLTTPAKPDRNARMDLLERHLVIRGSA